MAKSASKVSWAFDRETADNAYDNAKRVALRLADTEASIGKQERELAFAVYKFIIACMPMDQLDLLKRRPKEIAEGVKASLPENLVTYLRSKKLPVPNLSAYNPFGSIYTYFWQEQRLAQSLTNAAKMKEMVEEASNKNAVARHRAAKLILIAIDLKDESVLKTDSYADADKKWMAHLRKDFSTIALFKDTDNADGTGSNRGRKKGASKAETRGAADDFAQTQRDNAAMGMDEESLQKETAASGETASSGSTGDVGTVQIEGTVEPTHTIEPTVGTEPDELSTASSLNAAMREELASTRSKLEMAESINNDLVRERDDIKRDFDALSRRISELEAADKNKPMATILRLMPDPVPEPFTEKPVILTIAAMGITNEDFDNLPESGFFKYEKKGRSIALSEHVINELLPNTASSEAHA